MRIKREGGRVDERAHKQLSGGMNDGWESLTEMEGLMATVADDAQRRARHVVTTLLLDQNYKERMAMRLSSTGRARKGYSGTRVERG